MDAGGIGEQLNFHKMPLDRRKSTSTIGGDGDTCRICRGEGTTDQPLFYPCKCSGSIKYVHQDCLMEWLSHSQKKYCELCRRPFRFTKLYDKSMPATLPLPLFLRQVGVHAVRTLGRWLRYVFVTFIWTCWLPWSIRQIWRGLFWLADGSWMAPFGLKKSSTDILSSGINATLGNAAGLNPEMARAVSVSYFDPVAELFNILTGAPLLRGLLRLITSKPIPSHTSVTGTNATSPATSSTTLFARHPSLLSNVSSLNSLTKYPLLNNGLIDVLEGQLICLSVIAAFILVFLIREWVINQQPILNMPNPDRADAQPAPAQPNEDPRQQGRRRRRGLRRLPDQDRQPDNAQRQNAIPPPRRAATIDNITATDSTDQALERPMVQPRSSSLVPESTASHSMFSMDVDDEMSWHPEISPIESPPLQRGMFGEFVDIRRNIEENMISLPEGGNDETSEQASENGKEENITRHSSSDLSTHNDSIGLVSSMRNSADDLSADTDAALSPSLNVANPRTHGAAHQPFENATMSFETSASPWAGLVAGTDADDTDSSMDTPLDTDADTTNDSQSLLDTAGQNACSPDESEPSNTTEAVMPDTLLGRVTQWMWHTDEHIRVLDPTGELVEHEAADDNAEGNQVPPGEIANAANNMQAPAAAPAAAHEPNVQFGIDLNDPNALDDAEDLEGILELIGMEGPLTGMVQNIIFSVFLITLTLSASVWCPYIWGKIAILVMSNPVGVFIKAPLYFVSRCGNILVDILLFIGGMIGYGLSNTAKLVKVVLLPALPALAGHIKIGAVESWTYGLSQTSGARLERALSGTIFGLRPDLPTFSMQSLHALRVYRKAFAEASSALSSDILDTLKLASSSWQTHGLLGIPIFVVREASSFPAATISAAKRFAGWWSVLSDELRLRPFSEMVETDAALVEWTTEDKVLATFVGYAFFAAAGFAYLKIAHMMLGLRKDEKVDGIFADSLRQAGGVLKVIIIIGIEMIAFPLYCGLLLDCALLPLFKDATFQSRLGFLLNAPITCLFIHWFVGTCYMFHFALFVSMCRKIMRKGVLYFIRDPDDPTFHPVRDVLERPVATQLGKIAFSALVYGGLVIICLGGVVWTISSMTEILPVNWSTNEPRLAFPVDIVFYNFMLPFILRQAEPSKKISSIYEWWFRKCARSLRLSHFLFAEEREDEKFETRLLWQSPSGPETKVSSILNEAQKDGQTHIADDVHRDGRYVRVPAADSVRIPKGTKIFVEVNENNERIDGEPDRDTGLHGKKDERFVKTYVPPHFRGRVSIFVFLVWLFAASTGVSFTVLPLVTGRRLLRIAAASSSAPNDLYAFTVGIHVCGAIGFVGYQILTKRDKLGSKMSELFTNTKELLPRLFTLLRHVGGLAYLFTTVFVILPFATSLLTELYIHMPIYNYCAKSLAITPPSKSTSITSPSNINPTIFVLQTWTLGLLYMRLILRLAISFPNGQNRPSTALRAIVRDGYLHPDIALASRALVFPALTLCVVLLAAPLGLARLIIPLTGTVSQDEKLQIYRYAYPVLLGVAVFVYTALGIQHKIEGWRVKARDDIYLVGERLHNFTEPEGKKKKKAVKADKGKASVMIDNTGADIEF